MQKPLKTSLDDQDIIKLGDRIFGGVLVKDYAAYNK